MAAEGHGATPTFMDVVGNRQLASLFGAMSALGLLGFVGTVRDRSALGRFKSGLGLSGAIVFALLALFLWKSARTIMRNLNASDRDWHATTVQWFRRLTAVTCTIGVAALLTMILSIWRGWSFGLGLAAAPLGVSSILVWGRLEGHVGPS